MCVRPDLLGLLLVLGGFVLGGLSLVLGGLFLCGGLGNHVNGLLLGLEEEVHARVHLPDEVLVGHLLEFLQRSGDVLGGDGEGGHTQNRRHVIGERGGDAILQPHHVSEELVVLLLNAIRGGLAGSTVLDAKIPKILAGDFAPGGTIKVNRKDINNVLSTAHACECPMPFSSQLFEIMQYLSAHGHLMDDHGGIVQYFEDLAGVQVREH